MLRVLHIEDEALIHAVIKVALTKNDEFEVDSVGTLADAKANLGRGKVKYDVLLVDLGLPDSDGVNTVAELVKYNIPIIVLSGAPCEDCLTRAAAAGAEDYLVKMALTPERLIWRIKFVIERRAANKSVKTQKARKISPDAFEAVRPFISCPGL